MPHFIESRFNRVKRQIVSTATKSANGVSFGDYYSTEEYDPNSIEAQRVIEFSKQLSSVLNGTLETHPRPSRQTLSKLEQKNIYIYNQHIIISHNCDKI